MAPGSVNKGCQNLCYNLGFLIFLDWYYFHYYKDLKGSLQEEFLSHDTLEQQSYKEDKKTSNSSIYVLGFMFDI